MAAMASQGGIVHLERLAGRVAPPDNLPVRFTSFIGRRGELRDLRRLLAGSRLTTITGAGGVGKTSVAVALAKDVLARMPGGGWFVDLAPVTDRDLVAQTAAFALGLADATGGPAERLLAAALSSRPALLVLDNCEHVVAACAELARFLLEQCPELVVVATSREPLRLAGETLYTLPPLDTAGDAMRLFEERARLYEPTFSLSGGANAELARQVCEALDGLPLAIELAAARLRHLSLADLATRLKTAPDLLRAGSREAGARHGSLRAALDWSHALLEPDEQWALPRITVFRGGFDLDAAAAVLPPRGRPTVDLLGALVDRSLVVRLEGSAGRTRYRLLEPVRQYAENLLPPPESESVAELHAEHYLALAERFHHQRLGGELAELTGRLDEEQGNLGAAMERLRRRDPPRALRLAGTLWFFWFLRGSSREGVRQLEAALAAAPEADGSAPAEALLGVAWLRNLSGEQDQARAEALRALSIARECGDRPLACWCLTALGHFEGPESSLRRNGLASELAADAGLDGERAAALTSLATAYFMLGRREEALSTAVEGLQLGHRLKNPYIIGTAAMVPARDAALSGHPDAGRLWREVLDAARELQDVGVVQFALGWLAEIAALAGDVGESADAWVEGAAIVRRLARVHAKVQALEVAGQVLLAGGRPTAALRFVACAGAHKGRDWVESTFWTERTLRLLERCRTRAGRLSAERAEAEGACLQLDRALDNAESDIRRLKPVARKGYPARRTPGGLSRRELEVLELLASGKTNREIAGRLFISERTVEGHVEHILNKLGLANRAQAAAWIATQNLSAERSPDPEEHVRLRMVRKLG